MQQFLRSLYEYLQEILLDEKYQRILYKDKQYKELINQMRQLHKLTLSDRKFLN